MPLTYNFGLNIEEDHFPIIALTYNNGTKVEREREKKNKVKNYYKTVGGVIRRRRISGGKNYSKVKKCKMAESFKLEIEIQLRPLFLLGIYE